MQADGFFGASGLPPGAVRRAPGKIQEKAGEKSCIAGANVIK